MKKKEELRDFSKIKDFEWNSIVESKRGRQSIEEPRSYGYTKGTGLRLGKGFNPINVLDIKRQAIEFIEPEVQSSGRSSIDLFYADDYYSYQKVIRNDLRLSASYLSNSGGYSRSTEFDYSYDENSIIVVLRAETDYGEWILGSDAKLTLEAQQLLNNPVEFANRFGTRYISSENRINGLYVTFVIHNVSKKVKKTFKSSISASGGFGKLSVKAKSKFSKMISRSWKSNRMSMTINSIGGTGIGSLAVILENIIQEKNNPLKFIISSAKSVLETFTIDNAWPNEFYVASMKNFGLSIDPAIEWTVERNKKLIECKNNYYKLKSKYNIVKKMREGNHLINYLYDYGNINDLIYHEPEIIEERIIQLADLHKQLLESPNVSGITIPDVSYVGIADFDLERFFRLPTPNFNGRYLPNNSNIYISIPLERVIAILDTPFDRREQVIKNFYPNARESFFGFAPLGEGISVLKLYSEFYMLVNNEWQKKSEINRYTGDWAGFDIQAIEKAYIDWVNQGGVSRSRKDYLVIYNIEIINKANKSVFYELFRVTFYDQNYKVHDLKVEYNILEK
ncbi:hypothetical protein MHN29_07170 [Tenacibaculum sp. Cn5-46]|nr:hypothetical protein [Tenacibaculum sp. Cn5-46]